MSDLDRIDREEREDIAEAGEAFALYLKDQGLGDVVRRIGRQKGEMAIRIMLAKFAEARARRERAKGEIDDEIPF